YVNVIGRSSFTTVIKAANPNNDLIHGVEHSTLELVMLTGATGSGSRAIYYSANDSTSTTFFLARDVLFGENHTHVHVYSDGTNTSHMIISRSGLGDGYHFT